MIASASAAAASDRRGSADGGGGFGRTANIRRRASLLRKRLPNESSPHVGWFRHAPPVLPAPSRRPRASSLGEAKDLLRARAATAGTSLLHGPSSTHMKTSPYIGWFRHAPPSRLNAKKRTCPTTAAALRELLDLTAVAGSDKNTKHFKTSPSPELIGDYHLGMLLKTMDKNGGTIVETAAHVDGRLPGGHPLHGDDSAGPSGGPGPSSSPADPHPPPSFPPMTFLDQRVSASLRRHDPVPYHRGLERRFGTAVVQDSSSSSISDDASHSTSTTAFAGNADTPSATLGMLNRLAHWFLFPLANDAAGFADYGDDDALFHNRVSSGILTFIFPFLSSLLRNTLLLEGGGGGGGCSSKSKSSDIYHRDDGDGELSDNDDGESSASSSEQDEDDRRSASSSQRLDVSVSSLAERYYAHEACKELLAGASAVGDDLHLSVSTGDSIGGADGTMPSPPSNQQLDYVITQIDIARMVRNASRHLDVESILRLPTVTYRAEGRSPSSDLTANQKGNDTRHVESAGNERQDSPIKGAPNGGSTDVVQEQRQDPTIGWSWMMVPPDPDTIAARIPSDAEGNGASSNEDATRDGTNLLGRQDFQCDDDKEKEEEHADSCVICLEHFVDGDRLRVLPCTHLFHVGCIDKWLSGSYSDEECFTSGCPTCKEHPVRCREEEELGAGRSAAAAESGLPSPDGTVPSWAFTRLGDAMASSGSTISH